MLYLPFGRSEILTVPPERVGDAFPDSFPLGTVGVVVLPGAGPVAVSVHGYRVGRGTDRWRVELHDCHTRLTGWDLPAVLRRPHRADWRTIPHEERIRDWRANHSSVGGPQCQGVSPCIQIRNADSIQERGSGLSRSVRLRSTDTQSPAGCSDQRRTAAVPIRIPKSMTTAGDSLPRTFSGIPTVGGGGGRLVPTCWNRILVQLP